MNAQAAAAAQSNSTSSATKTDDAHSTKSDESAEQNDETGSITSATTDTTSCGTPTPSGRRLHRTSKGRHERRRKAKQPKPVEAPFRFTTYLREDHGQPLFGTQFNHHLKKGEPLLFATTGSNRVSVYECLRDGGVRLRQCYADPDPEEIFYTCCWSADTQTGLPLLAVAGLRGIVRVLMPGAPAASAAKHFIGHGHAINELKFHPRQPAVLLSASKDHSLRLWNVRSGVCIAIFGGVEGHRDEVLGADFDLLGERIMSCGMDHSLKLWRLDKQPMADAIRQSYAFDACESLRPFRTVLEHFPDYSTRDVHRNYVDCVAWLGDCLLSKSCENSIVCWRPVLKDDPDADGKAKAADADGPTAAKGDKTRGDSESGVSVLHRFAYKACDIWFVRFALDYWRNFMALGNQTGQTFVWELNGDDPTEARFSTLQHAYCTSAIRQTTFSRDGDVLICVCDDGTIWRWDRIEP